MNPTKNHISVIALFARLSAPFIAAVRSAEP